MIWGENPPLKETPPNDLALELKHDVIVATLQVSDFHHLGWFFK